MEEIDPIEEVSRVAAINLHGLPCQKTLILYIVGVTEREKSLPKYGLVIVVAVLFISFHAVGYHCSSLNVSHL